VAIKHYRDKFNKKTKLHAKPTIVFITDGKKEDYGEGPRREFYSQFFQKCICDQRMFVGSGRRMVPSNDVSKGNDLQFSALGVAIVEAILNGESGFPYLNEALYHFIIGDENYEQYLRIDELPDKDIEQLIEQVFITFVFSSFLILSIAFLALGSKKLIITLIFFHSYLRII